MNKVISVENLSKVYQLGQISTGTFSRDLETWWARIRGNPNPFLRIGEKDHSNRDGEELWALRDVTFEVQQGEVLGIIGRNGAGKSTLLKILSRVTAPTFGRIKVKGRIASLLEIGTGFHPELTGRENIYLNGAILGMNRKEISSKFNEIVEFSEVEKFIDTPVKRYSSGMYVRLAFAVAAHLEPEILIVDEVLAVGDAEFQKKCLGKMDDVAKEGRTVFFVSHNLGAVKSLCRKAILLDAGKIVSEGTVNDVVGNYLAPRNLVLQVGEIPENTSRVGTGDALLRSIKLLNDIGLPILQISLGQPIRILINFEVKVKIAKATIEVTISSDGTCVATTFSNDGDGDGKVMNLHPGVYEVILDLNQVFLPQRYTIDVGIHHYPDGKTIDFVERTLDFVALSVSENGIDRYWPTTKRGFVRPAAKWQLPKPIVDINRSK